jgi:uncharacterized protein (DUF2249 family)
MSKLITPKTRLMEIFENFPGLEEKLIALVPSFKKLNNPVLRRTVAKIATVQQAASIAKMPVNDLVSLLRREANQELENLDHNPDSYALSFEKPTWFQPAGIVQSLDLGPMLEAGEHPIHQVLSDVKLLKKGEIFQVIAPFLPAPLIDKVSSLGYEHFVEAGDGEAVNVYFTQGD